MRLIFALLRKAASILIQKSEGEALTKFISAVRCGTALLTSKTGKQDDAARASGRTDNGLIVSEVPQLHIVPQYLRGAVRERQARLEAVSAKNNSTAANLPARGFWTKQRPRYFFALCNAAMRRQVYENERQGFRLHSSEKQRTNSLQKIF
jgi:hypothetical protein